MVAIAAGKHVLVEPPTLWRRSDWLAVLAAAGSSRLAVNLPERSAEHVREAIALLADGAIGELVQAEAWSEYRRRLPDTSEFERLSAPDRQPDSAVYRAWLGDLADDEGRENALEFSPRRFHHHWRGDWATGCGELGRTGPALLDIARMGFAAAGVPFGDAAEIAVQARQTVPTPWDETPDTLSATWSDPASGRTIQWSHRLWTPRPRLGRSAAVLFRGTEGDLVVDRGGWKITGGVGAAADSAGNFRRSDGSPLERHLANFALAIRGRGEFACPLGEAAGTLAMIEQVVDRLRDAAG